MDKSDNLVSVIVPVFMAENYLDKCIHGIVSQSYDNIEIILIDDCSRDKSYAICEKYKSLDNRIIVSRNPLNLGVSKSRNIGISMSKGKYVLFVDSDDYIDTNYVHTLVQDQLKTKSDLIIASVCYVKGMNRNYTKLENKTFNPKLNESDLMYLIKENVFGYVHNKLFLRDIIKKNGIKFESKTLFEDQKFVIEYIKFCSSISIDSTIYYNYVNNESSAMNNLPNSYLELCEENYKDLASLFPKGYSDFNIYKNKYAISCAENFFLNALKRNSFINFKNLMIQYSEHAYIIEYRNVNLLTNCMYKFSLYFIIYYIYRIKSLWKKCDVCE